MGSADDDAFPGSADDASGRFLEDANAYTDRLLKATSIPNPFGASTALHASRVYSVRGYDATDQRLYCIDATNGLGLRQSLDWGTTWSLSKGLPTGVTWDRVFKVVRCGAYLYLLGGNGTTIDLYRAAPTSGDTALTWSASLKTLRAGSVGFGPCLTTDGTNLYLSEYGDPTSGPAAYRSPDGTTWTTIFGPDANYRHIHSIAPDPYNPGHLWFTAGDGVSNPIRRSTDYGDTWSVVASDFRWQGVQISFTEDDVFIAGDSMFQSLICIDKATLTPRVGSGNWHHNIAVPGPAAFGDKYYAIAFYGIVDPATGIYYCISNDTSSTGTNQGMFWLAHPGDILVILDQGGKNINMASEMFIAGDYLYAGQWRRPKLALA